MTRTSYSNVAGSRWRWLRTLVIAMCPLNLAVGQTTSFDTTGRATEIDAELSTAVQSYLDHARTYGQKYVEAEREELASGSGKYALGWALNYDFPYVVYQLSEVLNEPDWLDVAVDLGKAVSVDYSHLGAPGYYNYNSGYTVLSQDPRVSGEDREILAKAAENFAFMSAYSNKYTPSSVTQSNSRSREVALAVSSHLNARSIGVGPLPRTLADGLIYTYRDYMLGHVDQWLNEYGPEDDLNWAPFMMGLTTRSLIMYHDQMATEDEQTVIEEKLGLLSERIWDKAWVEEDHAFIYRPEEEGNEQGAPDLNLLVAPLYGWLFQQTEQPQYAERFDLVFIGGVEGAWLGQNKQFNQNYFWSLDGLRWRGVDLPGDDVPGDGVPGDGVGMLRAGDANQDSHFDQFDIIQVQTKGKYKTGAPATWGEGDWNGAPGGSRGNPPAGDGVFDELDIVAALQTIDPAVDAFAALRSTGVAGQERISIGYDANTGQVWLDPPAGVGLTSIDVDSAAGVFTGSPAQNLTGSFDIDTDGNVFKATFGSSFGSTNFGTIAQAGLAEQFVLDDLSVSGSLAGGGTVDGVDLIYVAVPEPPTLLVALIGLLGVLRGYHRHRARKSARSARQGGV